MTGILFSEWLRWFDQQMNSPVALLIDGFSAYKTGIDLFTAQNLEGFRYTTIFFLPTNATSLCQPLDQGIIRTWKACYRKRWLSYICDTFSDEKDPFSSMNVLQAIRWSISAWNEISPITIQRCWLKSRVLAPKFGPETEQDALKVGWNKAEADKQAYDTIVAQMATNITALAEQNRIRSATSIHQFLNPVAEENIGVSKETEVDLIAEAYSQGQREYKTDKEDTLLPRIHKKEALRLLQRLRLYEEQQDTGDKARISRLNAWERVIQERASQKQRQASITSFFS